MTYFPDIGKLVLFGGSGTGLDTDTWLFDGTKWTQGPSAPPAMSPRGFFGMSYDPGQHKVLVAGGDGKTDSWWFDGTSWTPGPDFAAGPGPKEQFFMTYDPQLGGTVMFGGLGPGSPTTDEWILRNGTWVDVPGTGGPWPLGRLASPIVWNPAMDALMIMAGIDGGSAGTSGFSDTWFFRDVPPQVAVVKISPSAPNQDNTIKLTTSGLTGGYKSWAYTYRWYVNGTLVPGATGNKITPNGGGYKHGSTVRAEAMVTDGLGISGPWVSSSTVTVVDRPPSIRTVTLSPGTVYQTSTMTATANNVADPDNDPVTLHYAWTVNGNTVTGLDSPTLSPSHFSAADTVNVTVTPVDSLGMAGPPMAATPEIVSYDVLVGTTGQPGKVVGGVHGGGFAPGETVDIKVDSAGNPTLATVVTDSTGAILNGPVTLPVPLSGGIHLFYAVGRTSGLVGTGPVTVVPDGSVTPASVAAGDTTVFSGVGFRPNEAVSVSFPGGTPVVRAADSTGSVNVSVISPAEPFPGGNATASAPSGVVTDPYTTLARFTAPASAEPGDQMPVTLTGFAPGEQVNANFDAAPVTQTYTASAAGSVTSTLFLDTTFGTHDVTMTGVTSGTVKTAFRISMPQWMTITPPSGPVGTVVSVSSTYGWVPGSTVHLYWGSTVVKDVTADANGSVGTTFTIPTHALGDVTMKLKDDILLLTATATFTVTNSAGHPPTIASASISGKAYVNQTLTAVASGVSDPDGDTVTLHYAWTVNGAAAGTDSSTLMSTTVHGGDVVAVTIGTVDSTGLTGGSATSPGLTMAWNVVAGSGVPGGTVGGVSANALGAAETVDVHMDSTTGVIVRTATTDASGKMPNGSITLPSPLAGGVHTLYAVGRTSGIMGWGPVTVTADGAISPSALKAGDVTTFSGVGFVPGQSVSVSFPGGPPVAQSADSTGSVSIPAASPPEPAGGGLVTASSPSGTVTDTFTSLAVFYGPTTGEPGDPALITLTGFGANETIKASFDAGPVSQTFAADGNGSLSANLQLSTTFGTHDITVTGASTAITKTDARVAMPAWMTVSPTAGPVGTVVTVTSTSGWVPGSTVHLYWGSNPMKDVTADANGSVSTTYTIPAHGPGDVTMKLKDDVLLVSPTATFTVTTTGSSYHKPS